MLETFFNHSPLNSNKKLKVDIESKHRLFDYKAIIIICHLYYVRSVQHAFKMPITHLTRPFYRYTKVNYDINSKDQSLVFDDRMIMALTTAIPMINYAMKDIVIGMFGGECFTPRSS